MDTQRGLCEFKVEGLLMKANISISHIVSFVILLVVVGGFLIFHLLQGPAPLWPPPITNHQSSISAWWIQQNIYINPNDQMQLVATEGKLIFIGSTALDRPFRLIALDEGTGKVIWEYGNTNEVVLAVSPSKVFVGEVGKITALSPEDGKIAWSTQLPFTRSVSKLLVRDNILYADTVSENHFLLETETGKILQTISYTSTDIPIWSDHKMNLVFTGNIEYFQKYSNLLNGEIDIVAIDGLNGNQLWTASVRAASRIAANVLGVYVLTLDGKLLRFDPVNGTNNQLIQFTPTSLQRNYSEGGTTRDYGYHIAIDETNQRLFVYLGDSAQLFAYRLPLTP
jgi:outer membrane protein assembly factor BamB